MRLSTGGTDALEEAYLHFGPLVYTMALRALGEQADAEDVTQQVFLAAWRGHAGLDPDRAGLPGWLVGIARHKIADAHERRTRDARNDLAVATEVRRARPDAPDPVLEIAVVHELEAMDEPRGRILSLLLLAGMSQSEVAEQLDLPLGTVKSHARRGLARLREQLKGGDGHE